MASLGFDDRDRRRVGHDAPGRGERVDVCASWWRYLAAAPDIAGRDVTFQRTGRPRAGGGRSNTRTPRCLGPCGAEAAPRGRRPLTPSAPARTSHKFHWRATVPQCCYSSRRCGAVVAGLDDVAGQTVHDALRWMDAASTASRYGGRSDVAQSPTLPASPTTRIVGASRARSAWASTPTHRPTSSLDTTARTTCANNRTWPVRSTSTAQRTREGVVTPHHRTQTTQPAPTPTENPTTPPPNTSLTTRAQTHHCWTAGS